MTRPYAGNELELFADAVRWKRYAFGLLEPYARGEVLDVGAGIGSNLPYLLNDKVTRWTCLEPDTQLATRLADAVGDPRVEIVAGTVPDLSYTSFDAIFYLDVLEHIEDDRAELARAGALLKPDGCLVVLAPAYPALYSPFDAAIGHWRRYTRRSLIGAIPGDLVPERSLYLDTAGLLASLANRALLRNPSPSRRQILFWDRVLIPVSRVLDPLVGRRLGRSVVVIARKQRQ